MRVCEEILYLPFTSDWAEFVRKFGVDEFHEAHNVFFKTSSILRGKFYPAAKTCIGDVRGLAERLLSLGDNCVELWCREFRWKASRDRIDWVIKSRRGETKRGSSQIIIDTYCPVASGGKVRVVTAPSVEKGSVLDLSGPFLKLLVTHGGLETRVEVMGEAEHNNALALSRFNLHERVYLGEPPVLYAGFLSGMVKPPWLGDYLVASALLGVLISENWLSGGDQSEKLLSYVTELKARAELCHEVAKRAVEGCVGELEISYIFEGIRPPPLPQL